MTAILRPTLSVMEQMILRNVLDGDRMRGVTLTNQAEHDATVLSLLRRDLIRHNPKRPRQRFNLTFQGRAALDIAERKTNGTMLMLVPVEDPTP